jgi:DNA-binding MarR family transcriptional regulator
VTDAALLSSSKPAGVQPAREKGQRSVVDEDAFELLLAFTRLARSAKHNEDLPGRMRALVNDGILAPRHLTAFAIVAMHGPLSISQLAQREGCATTTASLVATQLADAGLIERSEDVSDRRRTVISVAPTFRKDSQAVLNARLVPLRRAMERMGPDQARAVMDGLAILAEEIS